MTTKTNLYPTRTLDEIEAELRALMATAEPWPEGEWEQYGRTSSRAAMRAQAWRMFTDHGHGGYMDALTRENCSACCLAGYRPRGGWGDDELDAFDAGPNVSAWARDYIESGHPVPLKWAGALLAAASTDPAVEENQAYAGTLRRSLATWGVTFTTRPSRDAGPERFDVRP